MRRKFLNSSEIRLFNLISENADQGIAENLNQIVEGYNYTREYFRLQRLEEFGLLVAQHYGHGRSIKITLLVRQLSLWSCK